ASKLYGYVTPTTVTPASARLTGTIEDVLAGKGTLCAPMGTELHFVMPRGAHVDTLLVDSYADTTPSSSVRVDMTIKLGGKLRAKQAGSIEIHPDVPTNDMTITLGDPDPT